VAAALSSARRAVLSAQNDVSHLEIAFAATWRVFLPDHKGARESDVIARSAMTKDTESRLPYVLRWLAMTAAIVVIIYLFH
jgi:hypothetical protein